MDPIKRRRTCAVAGVAAAISLGSGVLVALPGPAFAATLNPISSESNGFLVLIEGNASLTSNESEGAIAIGGDLTIGGNYQVGTMAPSSFTYTDGAYTDPAATSLLVGGKVDFANSGSASLNVDRGVAHVGDLSNASISDNGNITDIVPTGGGPSTLPRVHVQGIGSSNDAYNSRVETPGLYDSLFADAFDSYRTRSAEVAALTATACPGITDVQLRDQNNQGPYPGTGNAAITLVPGTVNVLTLTIAQLDAITGVNGGSGLGTNTPLIINITDAGDVTFRGANWGFFQGNSSAYVLWNFPSATSITQPANGLTIWGSVLAPSAAYTDLSSGNISGNLIATSLVHGNATANGGEMHTFPFASEVPCLNEPGSTTSTTSTTTTSSVPETTSTTSTSTTSSVPETTSTTSTSTTSSVPETTSTTSTSTTSSVPETTSTTSTSTTSSVPETSSTTTSLVPETSSSTTSTSSSVPETSSTTSSSTTSSVPTATLPSGEIDPGDSTTSSTTTSVADSTTSSTSILDAGGGSPDGPTPTTATTTATTRPLNPDPTVVLPQTGSSSSGLLRLAGLLALTGLVAAAAARRPRRTL